MKVLIKAIEQGVSGKGRSIVKGVSIAFADDLLIGSENLDRPPFSLGHWHLEQK